MKLTATKGRILIVDDLQENLNILTNLLAKEGYKINSAKTGFEALSSINNEQPDLILLGILLPDMDGYEVCMNLKNNHLTEYIPVIFINALTNTKDILRGFPVGGIDYITKPFIAVEVLARVHTHLEMSFMRSLMLKQTEELKELNQDILRKSAAITQESIADIKTLSDASSSLLEFDSRDSIYAYIRNEIFSLTGADYVLITECNQQTRDTVVKQVIGSNSTVEKINSVLKKDIRQLKFSVDDLIAHKSLDKRKNICHVEGGLCELTAYKFPKVICYGIEKILGIHELFSIGFIWDNQYFGGICFAFKKENQFKKMALTESIIHQISLALSRIQTKELLLTSEENYRAIFENTGTATMIVDEHTNVLFANQEFINITGYSPEQVVGTSWTQYVAPESLKKLVKYSTLRMQDPNKAPTRIEAQMINSRGEFKTVILNIGLIPNTKKSVVSMLNISDLKNAEKQIAKSEEKYRSIFENIQGVYFEIDLEGVILELSPSVEKITKGQYKREDLIGKSFFNNYIDKEAQGRLINQLKNNEQIKDYEVVLKNKDDSFINCSVTAELHIDQNSKSAKVIGIFYDITEKKHSQEILKSSKEKFNTAFEMAPIAMTISDEKNVFIDVNKAFTKLVGYNREEVIGLRGEEVQLWANETERERAYQHYSKNKSLTDFEVSFRKKMVKLVLELYI